MIEGFLQSESESLVQRWHGKDLRGGEELLQFFVGTAWDPSRPGPEFRAFENRSQVIHRWFVTGATNKQQVPIREFRRNSGKGMPEIGLSFALPHRADAQDGFASPLERQRLGFVNARMIDLPELPPNGPKATAQRAIIILGDSDFGAQMAD